MGKALAGAVKDTAITAFNRVGAGANVVGSGVTVIMCTWDACLSFDARDIDAGFAWAGAAAAFLVATSIETAIVLKLSASFVPVGWVAAGIGVGLVFLAYYLKDTPIEGFFKNNALSDEEGFNRLEGESVGEYNKRLYLNRELLCPDSDYKKWNNFKLAGAHLTDLLVSSGVQIKPTKLINQKEHTEGRYTKPDFITTGYIKSMEIGISFRQFLKTEEQLAYDFYFYKNGLNGGYENITQKINPVLRIKQGTEKLPPQIVLNVEIPKEYTDQYTDDSILMIVSALSLGEGEFYPTNYNNETRLLGTYVSVLYTETEEVRRWGRSTKISLPQSNVAIDPLNQLLSGQAWED